MGDGAEGGPRAHASVQDVRCGATSSAAAFKQQEGHALRESRAQRVVSPVDGSPSTPSAERAAALLLGWVYLPVGHAAAPKGVAPAAEYT